MDITLLKSIIDNLVVKWEDDPPEKNYESIITGKYSQSECTKQNKKENHNQ